MVKPGYKKTEIGVIPEDWEIVCWEDVLSGFTSGATPYRGNPEYYNGTIRWVSSGELKYNTIFDTLEHISEEARTKTNLTVHPAGTFLMAITGLEAAGTRGSCALLGAEATTNQSCMAIYGTDKLDIKYLYHYYVSNGDRLAFQFCQGTKQQSYTAAIVKKLPILIPPFSEQQHISEALSDMDELIASLEKMISKKKAIKQGVMQELVTGKRRLSGFSGEWTNCKVGEIGDFYSGITGKSKADFGQGRAKYITFLNVLTNVQIDLQLLERVNINPGEKQNAVLRGDLFFNTSSETPEEVGMCAVLLEDSPNTFLNSFCFGYRLTNYDNDPLFLSYYFNGIVGRKLIASLAQGATRYNLSKSSFSALSISLPSKNEQVAIAETLSSMDREITTLVGKLNKTIQIKQGMMQQLLTGNVRI